MRWQAHLVQPAAPAMPALAELAPAPAPALTREAAQTPTPISRLLRSPAGRLALLGVLLEVVYVAGLVVPFPLLQGLATPAQDLASMTGATPIGAAKYLLTVAALAGLSWLAYREARHLTSTLAARLAFGFAALFASTLIWLYPIDALDVFDYAMQGRILGVLGGNPYVNLPAWYPDDPFLPSVGWKYYPSVYGPLWVLLGGAMGWLAGDDLLASLLLFKGLAALASLACAYGAYRLALLWRPQQAVAAVVLVGWNPLVVVTTGTGHNDVLMMALVLLGLWLLARGRAGAGLWVAGLSVLVKAATLPLAPILVAAHLGQRRGSRVRRVVSLLAAAVGLAVVSVALYAPLWPGLESLGTFTRRELFTASPLNLARELWSAQLGAESATRRAVALGDALLLAIVAIAAWRARGGVQAGARAAHDALFWIVFLALGWWQPWYVVWIVCLAAIDNRPWVPALSAVASLAALVSLFDRFFLTQNWLLVNPLQHTLHTLALVYAAPVLFGIGAPTVAALRVWRARRRRRPKQRPVRTAPRELEPLLGVAPVPPESGLVQRTHRVRSEVRC